MLSRSRFQTETPNVIDPGEETPSRPARVETDSESRDGLVSVARRPPSARSYNGFEDPSSGVFEGVMTSRQQQSNKGTISRGVRIDYILDADEEPGMHDSVDDEEFGLTTRGTKAGAAYSTISPLPRVPESPPGDWSRRSSSALSIESIEQARLFAVAMLNQSDQLKDGKQRQAESTLQKAIRYSRNYNSSSTSSANMREEILLLEDSAVYSVDLKRSRRRTMCRILALLVAVAMIVTFSIIAVQSSRNQGGSGGDDGSNGDGQSNSDVNDNMSPRLQSTIHFLSGREISMASSFIDPSSPQYKAARWIANVDSEQLAVPDVEVDTNPFHFVQRYILAVLYFSWKGDELWAHSLNFTSGIHECGWFQTMADSVGDEFAMGVGCDQALRVRSLLLRTSGYFRQLCSILCQETRIVVYVCSPRYSPSSMVESHPRTSAISVQQCHR
jgi:hypothetical protein